MRGRQRDEMKPAHITKIELLDGMKLRLHHDGGTKIIDIETSSLPERFPNLKDPEFFKKVNLENGIVNWSDDLQLDADELIYEWPSAKISLMDHTTPDGDD